MRIVDRAGQPKVIVRGFYSHLSEAFETKRKHKESCFR
jgi:hypothetical protein